MRISLSKHQRYAALAAAAIILAVLCLQITDEGFRGYGWVLGVLVAVILVMVGIGPSGSAAAPTKAQAHPLSILPMIDRVHRRHRRAPDLGPQEVEFVFGKHFFSLMLAMYWHMVRLQLHRAKGMGLNEIRKGRAHHDAQSS
ncbi:hypothetical protein HFN59_02380 [Rhizobium leguminosarum]|uniref:hypothetical protein n=1 Tax=Rhizobium leguminosarum TaxID=384 RepID=UPI001C9782C9|nr:hypothetical protein [Rhizobium leguminosarum]MBY5775971.1 hypothetical protein [Rhizobium leguminosarum]